MVGRPTRKTIEAMRASALDWTIADHESVASALGIGVRKPGGSHVYVTHPGIREGLSVPARRPIKPVYIRAFLRFVDALGEA